MKLFGLVSALIVSAPAFAAPSLESVVQKLNKECAGNGAGHELKNFGKKKVVVAVEMQKLKDEPSEYCKGEYEYSKSKKEGAEMAMAHLKKEECVREHLSNDERSVLYKAINQTSNYAVLAANHIGENAEACDSYRYRVFMADGKLMELEFNYTD